MLHLQQDRHRTYIALLAMLGLVQFRGGGGSPNKTAFVWSTQKWFHCYLCSGVNKNSPIGTDCLHCVLCMDMQLIMHGVRDSSGESTFITQNNVRTDSATDWTNYP